MRETGRFAGILYHTTPSSVDDFNGECILVPATKFERKDDLLEVATEWGDGYGIDLDDAIQLHKQSRIEIDVIITKMEEEQKDRHKKFAKWEYNVGLCLQQMVVGCVCISVAVGMSYALPMAGISIGFSGIVVFLHGGHKLRKANKTWEKFKCKNIQ